MADTFLEHRCAIVERSDNGFTSHVEIALPGEEAVYCHFFERSCLFIVIENSMTHQRSRRRNINHHKTIETPRSTFGAYP